MLTHKQIIERAGDTDRQRAERLGIKEYQARDWRHRGSIPPDQWLSIVNAGVASLEELAAAAAEKAA